MRLVSENAPDERSLILTAECVDILYDALDVLQPDDDRADRKRRRIMSMIAEHRNRDRQRRQAP